jgi:excisionase family DNA binding protein
MHLYAFSRYHSITLSQNLEQQLNSAIFLAPLPGAIKSPLENSDAFEPLLSADEAAEHLRVHVKTLQKLARERRVPCVRMGKYWRFRLSALDQWVTAQQNRISQPFRVSDGGDHLAIRA